jgi:hypothetical protein
MATSVVGITQLLHSSRCDILFLSDNRTTMGNIGRTRRMLEGALFNERHFLANQPGARTRAGGGGVLVHASLASKAHQVDILHPPDIGDDESCEAVEGRLRSRERPSFAGRHAVSVENLVDRGDL